MAKTKEPKMNELMAKLVSPGNLIGDCGIWHLILDNIRRLFEAGVMLGDPTDATTRFWPESEKLLGISKWFIENNYLTVAVVYEDANGDIFGTEYDPVEYYCPYNFLYLSNEDLEKISAKYRYDCEDHTASEASEAKERALYERLKAKYESSDGEPHTCANCGLMKKKLSNGHYMCMCGGEDHDIKWTDCVAWEPKKSTDSQFKKHLECYYEN